MALGMAQQLSLLDGLDDDLAPPAPAQPPALRPVPSPASSPVVSPPATAAAALPHHPEANRQALLNGQRVAYLLRRGQRRSIGFVVNAQGLTVTAPRWATQGVVDSALQTKALWVLRKLTQAGQQDAALKEATVNWADGVVLPWLGQPLTVRLGQPDPASRVRLDGGVLWVALASGASAHQIRDAVQAWMMLGAEAYFRARLDHHAPTLGVRWTRLRLSSAATRWGSAKADGSIRLHWRLMQFAPEVIDYVVVHELAHLRHMDHSLRFWQTVASVIPDYAALRARLKGERLPPW
jgi:predicted metal-dependent hydrolase